MKPSKDTLIAVMALALAALLWDRLSPAYADTDRRFDNSGLVKALEAQTRATQDVAREIKDAARQCRR